MTDASKLTDDELIDEMLKRFIVPQWYTRENAEDNWNVKDDNDFNIIRHKLRNIYMAIDDIVGEVLEDEKDDDSDNE